MNNHALNGTKTSEIPEIRVILLGGTIDSQPYKDTREFIEKGESPPFVTPLSESKVKEYLTENYPGAFALSQIELKDSQKINAIDTDMLLDIISGTDEPIKIVTMGTDAMARKAKEIKDRIGKGTDKVVLLVGAMEPLSHGPQSDGADNLDFVMQVAKSGRLKPGVYVAMPGPDRKPHVFHADKDLQKTVADTREPVGGRIRKYFVGNTVDITAERALSR